MIKRISEKYKWFKKRNRNNIHKGKVDIGLIQYLCYEIELKICKLNFLVIFYNWILFLFLFQLILFLYIIHNFSNFFFILYLL